MDLHRLGPNTTDEELLSLASALERAGDVRGELSRLQLRDEHGGAAASDRKRIKAILSNHHDELLDALAPFVRKENLVYRGGFIDECVMKDLPPNQHPAMVRAMESPLVRRIRRLQGPSFVVVCPSLVSLRHVRLAGGSITDLLATSSPLPWCTLDAYLSQHGDMAVLDARHWFPALEVLRLRGHIGCTVEELHASTLGKAVSCFAIDDQHASHARHFFEAGIAVERETQRLAFAYEPQFMTGKPPDFMVELALVRDSTGGWSHLEVGARLSSTLAHIRQMATQWLDEATTSLSPLPMAQVSLRVEGRQIQPIADSVAQALASRFRCDVRRL